MSRHLAADGQLRLGHRRRTVDHVERDGRGDLEALGLVAGVGQPLDSAIEKREEWAAAMSSSGLVFPRERSRWARPT